MDTSFDSNEHFSFSTENNETILLRNAAFNDANLIFDLSNEDSVRANSINQNIIAWEEHLSWLSNKLNNSNCFFLLAFTKESRFIGQIRIDTNIDEAIIGISISQEFRGKGLSTQLLMNSAKLYFEKFASINNITAKINKNNEPSINTFIKAGYVFSHTENINNNEFLVFRLVRNNEV
ncbi:MAG: acetyltransferase GNAT family [Ignavibacteria bacterium]|nr:MAG: acetyltransferase GNAT family [Ignavibacteria bacterium]KAF0156534.1 MAG: acetyltransferase GNAT family [Ignavibacteria bacterium]